MAPSSGPSPDGLLSQASDLGPAFRRPYDRGTPEGWDSFSLPNGGTRRTDDYRRRVLCIGAGRARSEPIAHPGHDESYVLTRRRLPGVPGRGETGIRSRISDVRAGPPSELDGHLGSDPRGPAQAARANRRQLHVVESVPYALPPEEGDTGRESHGRCRRDPHRRGEIDGVCGPHQPLDRRAGLGQASRSEGPRNQGDPQLEPGRRVIAGCDAGGAPAPGRGCDGAPR
jgi:hypothetical protein